MRTARAAIEDDFARKLSSLCRKPLGSQEMGSLKVSLDVMRGEVEAMAKQHANIAAQMKSELEEPLAAFAGGMKERRKIVQNGVERLLKIKIQQTQLVNKVRDPPPEPLMFPGLPLVFLAPRPAIATNKNASRLRDTWPKATWLLAKKNGKTRRS